MREQNTKVQEKNKNHKMMPTHCPPPPTPKYKTTTPNLSIPPSICNNNTMDMAFLLKMRQSNKCGNVRNYKIINLHLGSGAGP